MSSVLTRAVAAVAVVAAALVVGVVYAETDTSAGKVRAVFAAAPNVFGGLEVRLRGRKVGEIESSEYVDDQAVLELRIDDERVWPLRRSTSARLRFGSTVGVTARYVELLPGPDSAPPVPDDGLLTRSDTFTPMEFDEVFEILNRDSQGNLKALMANGAATLDGHADALGRALEDTPGGLDAVGRFTGELGAEPDSLTTLVRAGHRTSRAIASRDAELRETLTTAAVTFDELAAHTDAIEGSLERMPPTLRTARRTLARTDTSIDGLDALVGDLRPGARALRELAPSASRAIVAIDEVAPLASSTLERARASAPEIRAFLNEGTPFVDLLDRTLAKSVPVFRCVRPYGPEIAAFPSVWAGFGKNYDSRDHYARLLNQVPPYPNGTSMSSEEIVETFPGQDYAFPMPPGEGALSSRSRPDPFFQPECGAGKETVDASEDPEARR